MPANSTAPETHPPDPFNNTRQTPKGPPRQPHHAHIHAAYLLLTHHVNQSRGQTCATPCAQTITTPAVPASTEGPLGPAEA
eukprot:340057-Chlamydomonas_euryale.AAC.1